MNNGKIFLCLLLASTLLCSCANIQKKEVQPSAGYMLQKIQERGSLVVGTSGDQPPLNFKTSDGKIIGFDVDMARHMAEDMGVKLSLVTMPFHELLSALEAGKVDMILSGMTMTPERNLKVAFVGPYLVSGKGLLTNDEKIASIEEISEIDVPGTTLVALKGSTSDFFVRKRLAKTKLMLSNYYDEAVALVMEGKADALVADLFICGIYEHRLSGHGLIVLSTALTYEPLGIALPPNDLLFINWVETFLNTLEGSGELEKLETAWLNDMDWLKKLPENSVTNAREQN